MLSKPGGRKTTNEQPISLYRLTFSETVQGFFSVKPNRDKKKHQITETKPVGKS